MNRHQATTLYIPPETLDALGESLGTSPLHFLFWLRLNRRALNAASRADYAERFGVTSRTIYNYIQALKKSGEVDLG